MTARRWADDEWAQVLDRTTSAGVRAMMHLLAGLYERNGGGKLAADPDWRARSAEVYQHMADHCAGVAERLRDQQAAAEARRSKARRAA